jgi:glycosyltransferase involved in cell wall biosynthesis
VEDGANGYLRTVMNASSLPSAMQRLAELPPAERPRMGGTARRKVQERFNEEFVVKAYLDVLAGLDAAKPGI